MSILNPFDPSGDAFASVADQECAGCGCTDDRACPGGCRWVSDRWCSSCDAQLFAGAASSRVNLTPPAASASAGRGRKVSLEHRGPFLPHGRGPARLPVDVAAGPSAAAASTGIPRHQVAWHEISYRDPRTGPKTLRWVSLTDARAQSKKVARRFRVEVEIWAVHRDASGATTHSELVEVVR